MTGDLDGDGDSDVMAVAYLDHPEFRIYAYMNEGAFQFGDPEVPSFLTGYEPTIDFVTNGLYLVDVNSDGLADLVQDGPAWSKNLGNLQFGDPQPIADNYDFTFCDLDGQYGLDLITFNPSGNIGYFYYHQLEDGSFTQPQQITTLGGGLSDGILGGPRFLLMDLNGDGINDLLFTSLEQPEVVGLQVATGTAQGGFNAPQLYYTLASGQGVRGLSVADRDPTNGNNGFKLDTQAPFQTIWFEPTTGLDYNSSTTVMTQGFTIDLNADGALDHLSFDDVDLDVSIQLNSGSGSFLEAAPVTNAYVATGQLLADMDDDGDLDVLIIQPAIDRVAVLENDGSGTLNNRYEVTAGSVPRPSNIELVDLDSDGDLDLLAGNTQDIRMLLNDGTGAFSAPILIDEPNRQRYGVVHGDIDQDGDMDLLSLGYWLGVVLFRQDGQGQFTRIVLSDDPGIDRPRIAQFIDTDLDGDLDIVVAQTELEASFPDIECVLIENLGNGSFAPEVELGETGVFLSECLVMDINEDGLLDRIGDINGTIGVYLNNGSSFDDPLLFTGTFGKPKLIVDLNGDGLLDMMAEAEGLLVLWHATASMSFQPAQTVDLVNELMFSDLRDVNDDGRIDLVQLDGQQVLLRTCGANGLLSQSMVLWDFMAEGDPFWLDYAQFARAGDVNGDEEAEILVAVGQSSRVELLTNLSNSGYQLSGRIFHDLNGDQVYQPEESPLPWVNLQVDPDASSPFTTDNGVYTVYATPGTYTLQPALDPELWTVTSASPLQATLDAGAPVATGLDFAIVPAQDISLVTASMVQGNVPCGATTFLALNIANAGTRIEQGTVTLQLAQFASFQSSVPAPISIAGNTITWAFEDLNIQEVRSITALVTTPTIGSIGDQWNHVLQVVSVDDGGGVLSTTNATLGGTVTCAYDPNDKQVHPAGYGEAGAIGMDTPFLDYTIRFQNTGTAPAFDVVIMDQLDPDLDPERVELLGFSHTPTQVAITANGSIQFKFLDIMLPDSATDQLGSQGFVHFRIHLREGLPHLTAIPNTAAIYFDLNPPIITNTVYSTLVDCNTWQPELVADGYGVLRAPVGDRYQWFLNGEPIPGAVADTIQPTTNGSYTVEVTSTLGCVATTPAIISTDVPDTMAENGFIVVPNPFTQHARLIADETLPNGSTVTLVDRMGREVNSFIGSGLQTLDMDCGQVAGGLYMVRIERPGRTPITQRVVIQ
jgi:hypothetical protein